ncbi:hypothetical protein [Amycolatopsis sp. GA6-003]|uniref:hypothetical protein n=1 Tax=Amycolatopsis sp. GA6-003 TaxID=2652444 RepID=UPI0039174FDA
MFADIDTDYSPATPGKYLPIELHDSSQGIFEVVWVVGHLAGSRTVTVVRGREGTPARAWNAGTRLVCAPTAGRDTLSVLASADLPIDPHLGMRVARTNKQDVVERAEHRRGDGRRAREAVRRGNLAGAGLRRHRGGPSLR